MKTKLFCLVLIISGIVSCKKEQTSITTETLSPNLDSSKNLSIKQIKDWYNTQVSLSLNLQNQTANRNFSLSSLSFQWGKLESIKNTTGNYWLVHLEGQPSFENVKQGYRKLAFLQDTTGSIQARILEIIPDVLYIQRKQNVSTSDFTGRVFIYNDSYALMEGYVLLKGKIIGQIIPKPPTDISKLSALNNDIVKVSGGCVWNDNSYIDAEGVLTVYSEKVCSDVAYDGGYLRAFNGGGGNYLGNSGGGGGSVHSAPAVVNLPGEGHTKVNPKQFMTCFGNIADAGASTKVTIYVQEPFPGTSFAVGPNSVGHVAIGLTKTNDNASITQVVGFYPDATGYAKLHAPSKVVNNGGDLDYNVSITYTVSSAQFAQITNYISNPPATYDLSTFNCTNFVYSACQAGNITLPDPYSTTGFNGATMTFDKSMTPAGLGSSIESLKGSNNVNTNVGTTPNSKGPCN